MKLRTIEEILREPVKYKPEYKHLGKVNESYRGINRNVYTNNDISEAINTAAGIDDYLKTC